MITRTFFCLFISTISLAAHGVEVTKADWVNSMATVIPTTFCNPNYYFRQCFDVTAQECERSTAAATRVCLDKYQNEIPSILIQPKDGAHWGTVIGSCAGKFYSTAKTNKYVKSDKCDNPKNWQ